MNAAPQPVPPEAVEAAVSYVRAYPWPEGLVTEREFCTGLLAAAAPAVIAAHRADIDQRAGDQIHRISVAADRAVRDAQATAEAVAAEAVRADRKHLAAAIRERFGTLHDVGGTGDMIASAIERGEI